MQVFSSKNILCNDDWGVCTTIDSTRPRWNALRNGLKELLNQSTLFLACERHVESNRCQEFTSSILLPLLLRSFL